MMGEQEARERLLQEVAKDRGFVPNLVREMASSPAAARSYLAGQEALSRASLDEAQRQIAQLAISVFNEGSYCRAVHAFGARIAGVERADFEAVERGNLPEAPRLRSVVAATWQLLEARGFLAPQQIRELEAEGVERPQLYEIVVLIGLKTISNYIAHLANLELDLEFADPRAVQAAQD